MEHFSQAAFIHIELITIKRQALIPRLRQFEKLAKNIVEKQSNEILPGVQLNELKTFERKITAIHHAIIQMRADKLNAVAHVLEQTVHDYNLYLQYLIKGRNFKVIIEKEVNELCSWDEKLLCKI